MTTILDLLFMFKDHTMNIGNIPNAQSAIQFMTDATYVVIATGLFSRHFPVVPGASSQNVLIGLH